jgi:hypothetical protein
MDRIYGIAVKILTFAILPLLFISLSDEAYAKKRKKKKTSKRKVVRIYNPSQTKQNALKTLTGSGELSALAGIESSEEETQVDPATITNFIDRKNYSQYETDRSISQADDEGEDLNELAQEDDVVVDIDNFKMMWMSFMFEGSKDLMQITQSGIEKQEIMNNIMDWIGTPYLFGGTSRRAIDCSAFVRAIFQGSGNIMLPRTAAEQNTVGLKVARKNLEFGDLIFFNTRKNVYVSHVGIYLGDNLFAHASSRYGVTISSLESEYYSKRLIGAKRITQRDVMRLSLENGKKS